MSYSQNSINNDFMQVFRNTLPGKNSKINEKDAGHIYVSSINGGKMQQKAVFTQKGLRRLAGEQYVTASSFFNSQWGRKKKNLRWINALVLDFDVEKNGEEIDKHDIVLRVAEAGLPAASMLVRTPSGGIHAWWFLKPVRGTQRAIRLYETLHASLVAGLGADTAAVGAERPWRLPTNQNVIYSSKRKYKLSVFRNWRDENRPQDMPGQQQRKGQVYAFTAGLLSHPAIKRLKQGVSKGHRDNACFSLAVAHLLSSYSTVETEQILLTWNQLNTPAMQDGKVIKCVASAVKGLAKDYQHYYNAMRSKIRDITGIEIKYRPITPAKARNERKRSHIDEYKQDILNLLQKRGGRMIFTQSSLAKQLNAPLRSIKLALKELEKSGSIFKDAIRRGKKSFTIIISKLIQNCKNLMVHSRIHYGEQGVSLDEGNFSSSELDECLLL